MSRANCWWCAIEDHLKHQCSDYGKPVAEGIDYFIDPVDKKSKLGPMGTAGVMVQLRESKRMWQKECVEQERNETESQSMGGPRVEKRGGTLLD
jgi:hypothetical protein